MFGVLIIYYGTYNNRRYYYITHKLQTLRRYVMLASQQMSALPLLLIDLQPQQHTSQLDTCSKQLVLSCANFASMSVPTAILSRAPQPTSHSTSPPIWVLTTAPRPPLERKEVAASPEWGHAAY